MSKCVRKAISFSNSHCNNYCWSITVAATLLRFANRASDECTDLFDVLILNIREFLKCGDLRNIL